MNATTAPRLVDVKVERDTRHGDNAWSVHPIWADVDRPDTGGWVVTGQRLARRLERACRAGAAFGTPTVQRDVYGKTYVSAPHRVMAKYANADLRRLGF